MTYDIFVQKSMKNYDQQPGQGVCEAANWTKI